MDNPPSETDKPDKVGYKNPPKHSQFKPGQSGNSKGRPKNQTLIYDTLASEGFKRHRVTVNGKAQWLTSFEITAKSLWAKAMKGDNKAVSLILELLKTSTLIQQLEANHPVIKRRKSEKEMDEFIKQMSRKGGLKL